MGRTYIYRKEVRDGVTNLGIKRSAGRKGVREEVCDRDAAASEKVNEPTRLSYSRPDINVINSESYSYLLRTISYHLYEQLTESWSYYTQQEDS